MSIREELLALKNKDGLIVPERAVVWAAKHPKSALHASLEWDDTKAASEFRIWQVRRLIAITIITDEGVRSVVSLSTDRSERGGGYREVDDVLPVRELRDIMLSDALADLDRVQEKYKRLEELALVWAEKEKVRTLRRQKKAA
jgi:hypothetical protein